MPPIKYSEPDASLTLMHVGTCETGVFGKSAAEIVAFHAARSRILVVNAPYAKVEVLDGAKPGAMTELFDLQATGVLAADSSTIPEGTALLGGGDLLASRRLK